ncbi:MAG: helix-turn-helix domain-containing protein [Candidatus Limnocylindrus sp.]
MTEPEVLTPQPTVPTLEITTQAPSIGDRLRQARERRGVSIDQASATLKIRAPILEAFEREDHTLLPPRVYALGQLRTYAAFLGLDPATVVAGWHEPSLGTGSAPAPSQAKATATDRLAALRPGVISSTRGVLAIGGLGILVLVIGGFMVLQLLRFLLPPSIAITYPMEAISNLGAGTLSYEIRGTADANASIIISTSAGAQLTTQADESGLWSLIVPLGTGRTEIVANSVKAGTGGDSSATAERVFLVALPDKVAPEITISQPSANLVVQNGDVPISLSTTPNSDIAITATDTAGGLITTTLTSDDSGAANGGINLPAGRWTLSFSVTSADGALSQTTRTVEVSFTGVTVTVASNAATTWIRVWIDGQLDPTIGVSGKTVASGAKLTFTGEKRIEVRSGDPASLQFTLNGRTISGIGTGVGAETYAFLSTGQVQKSSRR